MEGELDVIRRDLIECWSKMSYISYGEGFRPALDDIA